MKKRLLYLLLLLNYNFSIAQDGSIDPSFDLGTGADNFISGSVIQADGKIIVAGYFTTFNGVSRNRIARLNSDGTLDTSFDPGSGADGVIFSIALQTDGKIIIGGLFNNYNGVYRNHLARLNSNGTLDTSFDPGSGPSDNVPIIALQTDGKILIGGGFTMYNGSNAYRIARLNTDGTIDTGFNTGLGANNDVNAIAVQPNGKIVIGGWFTSFNGLTKNRISRLNSDGSLDASFNAGMGFDDGVKVITLQSDGKLMVGGYFTSFNGVGRNKVTRLNEDGTIDTNFDPGTGGDEYVLSIVMQTDEKIILGGAFISYNGVSIKYIARLFSDGSLDTSFDPGTSAGSLINKAVLQSDGKIVIVGYFNTYNGINAGKVARIKNCFVDNSLNTIDEITLEANSLIGDYQWLDCNDNYSVINGATNQQFTAFENGSYAVQVDVDGCILISDCISITTVGLTEAKKDKIQAIPNPVLHDKVMLYFGDLNVQRLEILDINGQKISSKEINSTPLSIDMSEFENGSYIFRFTYDGGILTERILKL